MAIYIKNIMGEEAADEWKFDSALGGVGMAMLQWIMVFLVFARAIPLSRCTRKWIWNR
jgi:hypothetical protein